MRFDYWLAQYFPFVNNHANRAAWVINQLRKLPKGKTIIDLGAGECQYKPACAHLIYTAQDNAQYQAEPAAGSLHPKSWQTDQIDLVCDIINLPLKNHSFDYALCTEVLEHLPSPELAIAEISRILKPDGQLILTAPFCSLTHFAPYHYCTGFNRFWYQTILPRYGFKIISLEANGNYFDYLCQELLRLPLIIQRYSKVGLAGWLICLLTLPLIAIIFLISKTDQRSAQLLCFGYHLRAKKLPNSHSRITTR